MTPTAVLEKYYGYSSFRPGQLDIIQAVIRGEDTLALLPTGGGKSLCFQIPGLVLGGTTIVISPLISLMKDQVESLVRRGIPAVFINSSQSKLEQQHHLRLLSQGKLAFVYVSPERLLTSSFIKAASLAQCRLLVIDESHCIAQWGHDFRPEYKKISQLYKQLPHRPTIMAVTATATPETRREIIHSLKMRKPRIFINSFARSNLFFSVMSCHNKLQQDMLLFRILQQHRGEAGIIYGLTRDTTEWLAKYINLLRFNEKDQVVAYHAGLTSEKRAEIQDQFLGNEIRIITATNAFGMGVDKPDVRFVIHYQMPDSIENYYQEAGRAGRDTLKSHCYLLYNPEDLQITSTFINQSGSKLQRSIGEQKLKSMWQYAKTKTCYVQKMLNYFGEELATSCHNCSACVPQTLSIPDQEVKHFHQLKCWRDHMAKLYHKKPHEILSTQTLHLLALHQPRSRNEYRGIPGIGDGWIKSWYASLNHYVSEAN